MPSTSGKIGRKKLAFEVSRERSRRRKQKIFEKILAFLK
jgi:hypothetical protein